jgi:hypothetical protein
MGKTTLGIRSPVHPTCRLFSDFLPGDRRLGHLYFSTGHAPPGIINNPTLDQQLWQEFNRVADPNTAAEQSNKRQQDQDQDRRPIFSAHQCAAT